MQADSPPTIMWYVGGSQPPPITGQDAQIVPSLQCISVTSNVLNTLNANPFRTDMAYGSIYGTVSRVPDQSLSLNLLQDPEPQWAETFSQSPGNHSYCPWFGFLDGASGASDGVVPVWSAMLPGLAQQEDICHIDFANDPSKDAVKVQVRNWLSRPVFCKARPIKALFKGTYRPKHKAAQMRTLGRCSTQI